MTLPSITNARERVVERLTGTTVVQGVQIEDATEIYGDLRISGWDLWKFLDWVRAEFGTDFSAMNVSKYSPGEGAELFAGTYRSLTVGAILDAISQGAWTETANSPDTSPLHPALAVLLAYGVGIIVGNVLWLPYTGALAVAFVPGGLVMASPLLAIAMLFATVARTPIARRPALSCLLAVALVVAVWAAFDNPVNRAAVERLALAATCATISALTFYRLSRPSRQLG